MPKITRAAGPSNADLDDTVPVQDVHVVNAPAEDRQPAKPVKHVKRGRAGE